MTEYSGEISENLKFERSPVTTYLENLKGLFLHPRAFYRGIMIGDPTVHSVAGPLAFGLVSHWLGRAIEQLWTLWLNPKSSGWMPGWSSGLNDNLGRIEILGRATHWHEAQARFQDWFSGVGSVVADPFITLLFILAGASLLFVSARVLIGAPRDRPFQNITFNSTLKIVAYGQAASLLAIIPAWGATLASLGAFWLTWVGTREFYNVSGARAFFTVLFSKVSVVIFAAAMALSAILILMMLLLFKVFL